MCVCERQREKKKDKFNQSKKIVVGRREGKTYLTPSTTVLPFVQMTSDLNIREHINSVLILIL